MVMRAILLVVVLALHAPMASLHAGEMEHYDLKLNFPFNKVEGPVTFGFEATDGVIGRAWCAGLPGAMQGTMPRFAPDLSGVKITAEGLTGLARIGRVREGTNISYYSGLFTLDVKRTGEKLAGTWEWKNGVEPSGVPVNGNMTGGRSPSGGWAVSVALPNDMKAQFNLATQGGKVTDVTVSRYASGNHLLDWSGVTVASNRLTGKLTGTLMPDGMMPADYSPNRFEFTMDATADDKDVVTGTVTGQCQLPVTWTEKVAGRVLSEETWRALNQFAAGPDWPAWMGPFGDFRAGEYGQRLVERLDDAWLVWRGETIRAGGRGSTGTVADAWPNGGGGSPIVKDGRVFLYYYLPGSGPTIRTKELSARIRRGLKNYDRTQWSISADEEILCLDAATGRTLWKTHFKDTGVFQTTGKRPLATLTPVALNDRVCFVGTSGRIFALDAATGAPLWESAIPGMRESLDDAKWLCQEAAREVDGPGRCSALNYCAQADVLLTADFVNSGTGMGLMAFDGKTGQFLWNRKDVLGTTAPPMRWEHAGREYVIVGNHKGEIRCLEPRTGQEVWLTTGAEYCNLALVIHGDYLLAPMPETPGRNNGNHYKTIGRLGCFRLAPEGATLLWNSPEVFHVMDHYTSSIQAAAHKNHVYFVHEGNIHCRDIVTGKTVATAPVPPDVFNFPGKTMTNVGRFSFWEDRMVSAFNMSHERQLNGGVQETKRFTVVNANPEALRFREAHMWVHQRFNSYEQSPTWAYVDGRFIVRGEDAIYCYDLRQDPKSATAPLPPLPATVTRTVSDEWWAMDAAQKGDALALLATRDVPRAVAAAKVLGLQGPSDRRIAALTDVLKGDADRRLKIAALTALQGYERAAGDAVPALLAFLENVRQGKRTDLVLIERTLSALVATGKADAVLPALDILDVKTQGSLEPQVQAIRMLARLGPAGVPVLQKGLATEGLKWPVIVALGELRADAKATELFLQQLPYITERAGQKRRDDTEYWSLLATLEVLGEMKDDPKVKATLEAVAAGPQDHADIAAAILSKPGSRKRRTAAETEDGDKEG